eukprot:SAG31_NODE_19054_length_613_cov_1.073930_2_plen_116_part_01
MLQSALAASGGATDTASAAEALSAALNEPTLPDPPPGFEPPGMLGLFAGQVRGSAHQQEMLAGALKRAESYEAAATATFQQPHPMIDTRRTTTIRVQRQPLLAVCPGPERMNVQEV